MKGLFRQACTTAQANRYCGQELSTKDFNPGILRFHGGYPTDTRWTDQLLDIIHPQQDNQVKSNKRSSAFFQVSLYKPELKFGISSTETLDDSEWETVWGIWEKAIASLHTGLPRVALGTMDPLEPEARFLYRSPGTQRPGPSRQAYRRYR